MDNGVKEYERKRPVDEKLNNDFFVNKLAVYKEVSATYSLVFKLNDNTVEESALKYSMAIYAFVAKEFLIKRDDYLLLDYKPELEVYNSNNYFIREFKSQAKRIDNLDVFLFGRDKYRPIFRRKVTVRNIGLRLFRFYKKDICFWMF